MLVNSKTHRSSNIGSLIKVWGRYEAKRGKKKRNWVKEIVPALQEVGGSFWRSLSSFRIRLEAMEKEQKKIHFRSTKKRGRCGERERERSLLNETKKEVKTEPSCRYD